MQTAITRDDHGHHVPTNATMLTGGLGYSYNVRTALPLTQTNLPDYPAAPSTVPTPPLTAGMPNATGGLIVIAPNKQVVGERLHRPQGDRRRGEVQRLPPGTRCVCRGRVPRRPAQRRDDLRVVPHAEPHQQRLDGGLHRLRALDPRRRGAEPVCRNGKFYTWHAVSADNGYWGIGYPGILNNCEGCHAAGMYDFSASASANAAANRLFRTVATGTFDAASSTAFTFSPWITTGFNYGSGPSFSATTQTITQGAATTLVTSPTTTVCLACHVSPSAQSHFKANGGSVYAPRGGGTTPNAGVVESCDICHGPGRAVPIAEAHRLGN